MNNRLKQIRESEKKSHIEMYSNEQLYKTNSWLRKPIKTIQELIPLFKEYRAIKVLDLGCGVGRNCLAIACEYKDKNCIIDCVDILELAIDKLKENAKQYGVTSHINGVVDAIENYVIPEKSYDFIMAVSALEHIDTEDSFLNKLVEIREGICENGVVCLVINTDVRERELVTGNDIPAQFEVNLPTEKVQLILKEIFAGWTVIKFAVQEQQYDIPRESGIVELSTNVVSFVAKNEGVAFEKDKR